MATFVTQASILEGYAVGTAVLAAGLYGVWRLEQLYAEQMKPQISSDEQRAKS